MNVRGSGLAKVQFLGLCIEEEDTDMVGCICFFSLSSDQDYSTRQVQVEGLHLCTGFWTPQDPLVRAGWCGQGKGGFPAGPKPK